MFAFGASGGEISADFRYFDYEGTPPRFLSGESIGGVAGIVEAFGKGDIVEGDADRIPEAIHGAPSHF